MVKKRFVIACLFLLMTAVGKLQAQDQQAYYLAQAGAPNFHLSAITLLSEEPGKTKMIAYVEIVHDNLMFVRSARGFEANYEVDFSLILGEAESGPRVTNKIWRSQVVTTSYDETNARDLYDISETEINVSPGTYTIVATLLDLESKRKSEASITIQVPSYEVAGMHLSDLVLCKHVKLAPDNVFEITPNVNHVVQNPNYPVPVFYEVYPEEAEELKVYYRVMDDRGEVVREDSKVIPAVLPITRDHITFSVLDLPYGYYVVELQIEADGQRALKGTHFRLRSISLPASINDMKDAVRQLRYIASNKEIKKMLNGTPDQMERMFRDFWDRRDPSENTKTNELMEEYYGRIQYCNEMFGSFRAGWETDMGEVYIRFGPPSEIERHPFEINYKPYEIWYYYDLRRRFIFVDEMGYGEYRRVSELWP